MGPSTTCGCPTSWQQYLCPEAEENRSHTPMYPLCSQLSLEPSPALHTWHGAQSCPAHTSVSKNSFHCVCHFAPLRAILVCAALLSATHSASAARWCRLSSSTSSQGFGNGDTDSEFDASLGF